MSYLLDTNICIPLLKSKEELLIAKIKKQPPSDFKLCSIVRAELLYGARKSQKVDANLKLLNLFFNQFDSLSFDDLAAEFYGTLRVMLEKSGSPIGANDLIIASIAQANHCTLVTRNREEFSRVPGLRIETW